jgi:hypothetical protein
MLQMITRTAYQPVKTGPRLMHQQMARTTKVGRDAPASIISAN